MSSDRKLWRSDFIFYHPGPDMAADRSSGIFEGADFSDVEPDGAIKLKCSTAGCGFGISEHDADFHANLIDEY